jgi:hypothetical protein
MDNDDFKRLQNIVDQLLRCAGELHAFIDREDDSDA